MKVEVQQIIPSRDPFGKLFDKSLLSRVGRELTAFGKEAVEFLQEYPPKPPDSTYKRTGTLKGGWRLKEYAGRYEVKIFNEVKDPWGRQYAVWVQGRSPRSAAVGPKQRKLFKEYGWRNITDVKTQVYPKYRARILKILGFRTFPRPTMAP